MTDGEPTAESRFLERWLPVLLLALAGLMVRVPILFHDHPEGDERLYTALVQQLDSGRGYTLVGHPILGTGHFNPAHYATPLFFHPPGGILVFLGAYRLGGPTGLGSAQLAAFLVFFAGILVLARGMLGRLSNLQLVVLAALGAATPVVAHVNTKIWIDNPKIALATLGGGLLLLGLREERRLLSTAGGLLLGGGCFTKIDTALVLPPLLLVAIVVLRPRRRSSSSTSPRRPSCRPRPSAAGSSTPVP